MKEKIENIMNQFNFPKVHFVMKELNWKWYLNDDENGSPMKKVPTVEEIKDSAETMLKRVADYKDKNPDMKRYSISSGGLTAGIDVYELYLMFTLEEVSSDL